MSADTNPHELLAQYKKAKSLASFLIAAGVRTLNEDPTDHQREVAAAAVPLASPPSVAVWRLAGLLMNEYYEAVGQPVSGPEIVRIRPDREV